MSLGKKGELIASRYLISRGYEFIFANYRTRWGEIDLIFEKDGVCYFVEVKTRTAGNQVAPHDQLPTKKLQRLEKAADEYIKKHSVYNWHFLLIRITVYRGQVNIRVVSL